MTSEKTAPAKLETILRPGQTVAGKYCVDHLIAVGGMAAVWAGMNLRTGKRVALKVILRSFASTLGADELFRREALAASRVNHPNVVTIFDVVDHAGRTCIVMELLNGENLGAYFARQGFLNVEEAVALLLPAMRGVAAANAQGVVHRDLKPQNIFLCVGDDGRLITTKIVDFGISVIAERASQRRTTIVPLVTHGTPAYMSPEHITGSQNIDDRADVYGFGVILFEALAGQAPFVGEPGPLLLSRILEEPAPSLTLFRPDLPPEVDTIIQRALAKKPDDRFSTLNHFIAALEDNFLPRSPMLRSLTPVYGVPVVTSGSGPSGLADPVVQVRQAEPSGEHDTNVTKALYRLSSSRAPSAKHELPLAPPHPASHGLPPASAPTAEALPQPLPPPRPASDGLSAGEGDLDGEPFVRSMQRKASLRRLLLAVCCVGATVAGVAWLLVPNRSHHWQSYRQREAPAVPTAPAMPSVEVPATTGEASPIVLPPEAPEVPELPSTVGVLPADSRSRPPVKAKTRATPAPPRPKARQSPGEEQKPAAPVQEPPQEVVPRTDPSSLLPPPAGTAPRAGRLSTDDF